MMKKTVRLILFLVGLAVAAGCSARQTEPAPDTGKPKGPPLAGRTLQVFQSTLTTNMTPKMAAESFGEPDRVTGSGLIIYVYSLADGRELWLGFPGFAPIRYAVVKGANGGKMELKLK